MPETCCPRFDPEPWDNQELVWEGKRFVKDRVMSFLHIPLNFGSVMKRNVAKIEAAGAKADEMIVLSDENSIWGADVYLSVAKDVPNAELATLSGTFLSKVFEGPYRSMRSWMLQMEDLVSSKGQQPERMLTYYTTCPRCAKEYGKNYVVLLAQVQASA